MAANKAHLGPIASLLQRAGLTVLSLEEGYVVCPGRDLHTTPNSDKDCRAWANAASGVPAIHCFHTSCAKIRAEVNEWLWRESRAGRAGALGPRPLARSICVSRPQRDPSRNAEICGEILRNFRWQFNDIENDPRGRVTDPPHLQWPYLIALFSDDAIIWIGRDIYDSGKPAHRYRFRTVGEWLRCGKQPGAYICPNRFQPDVWSRSNENVLESDFLVVESDELGRDEVGAVFRFIEHAFPTMRLRAVVDTGGKSLHAWFNYPGADDLATLHSVLPRLKCDPAMFRLCQPTRLPGVLRPDTSRYQRLIYFRP